MWLVFALGSAHYTIVVLPGMRRRGDLVNKKGHRKSSVDENKTERRRQAVMGAWSGIVSAYSTEIGAQISGKEAVLPLQR